MIYENQKLLSL